MQLVPLKTRKTEADEAIVAALEKLLVDAKAGRIHRLLVVGIDDTTGDAHRLRHRTCDTTMIGAVSCALAAIQAEWNS